MTINYFLQLADYNIWANKIAGSWLEKISEEQWKRPIISSFNSIWETVVHTTGAEIIWLDRLNGKPNPAPLIATFNGTSTELLQLWNQSSESIKKFIEEFDENKLKTTFKFKRLNGVEYEQAYYQVFAHLFNHSTYHRGQLVTMLRQAGFTDISSTDLINYFR